MKRHHSVLSIALCLMTIGLFIVPSFVLAAEAQQDFKYVASKDGKRYHTPDCQSAKKIKPEQLVKFKTVKEAQDGGYTPCKICKPPEQD